MVQRNYSVIVVEDGEDYVCQLDGLDGVTVSQQMFTVDVYSK